MILRQFDKLLFNQSEIFDFVENKFLNETGIILSYFNQSTFNIYFTDKNFREIFDSIKFYQEGIGCFIGFNFLNFKNLERIDSTHIIDLIFQRLIISQKKIFISGGQFEEDFIKNVIKKKYSNVVGYFNGYFSEQEFDKVIEEIRKSKAEYVLLGMGQPKQELVALKLKNLLPEINFFCVGNFFNFHFRLQRRAPLWVRNLQLEWFFRFLLEPKRLFKRYFIGIPLFFWRIILLKFKFYN